MVWLFLAVALIYWWFAFRRWCTREDAKWNRAMYGARRRDHE